MVSGIYINSKFEIQIYLFSIGSFYENHIHKFREDANTYFRY